MAVTYDFQTPGVSTSAADTQEDIRNIAEMSWVWHVNASPHSLTNKPTGLIEAFYTGSSNNQNYYNLRAYDGTNLVKVNFKELFVDLDGPVLTNTVGARGNEFIAMGVAPGYYCESLAPWSIHADYGNTGTSTYDPILALVNQGTERARIYTDTSDSHKLKFDVGGADRVAIDSSGNVGVNTTTMTEKLQIENGNMRIYGTTGNDVSIIMDNQDSADIKSINFNGGGALHAKIGVGGTSGDIIADSTGQDLSVMTNGGGRAINFSVDGTTTHMKIAGTSGNVGIGTSSPSAKLDIDLATENFAVVDAGSASATEQDWIEVTVGGTTGYIRVHATK